MAHYSIGRGSGSFVGGHIIGKVGIRQAFKLMGMVAVTGGCSYAALYYFWLRKIEVKDEEDEIGGETEKLKDGEPKYKDQATMVSLERLSLMVEYNQIGSLTSLGRHHLIRTRSNSMRRGSLGNPLKQAKSTNSKIDILKSAIEINQSKNAHPSNNHINKNAASSGKINADVANSVSKLHQRSASLVAPDQEIVEKFLLNEKDEIVYDEIKRGVKSDSKDNIS
ncbi:hypothetical protein NQ318_021137 [Aromia moschata]|uniref:Uncharacterized protein n=1 Tax=Aromia moschata TaxID=1265417 RepID=A0AAV8YFT9_9CUCU|nr:hypothetical protein NQ318_021137 [Aromia moschata]